MFRRSARFGKPFVDCLGLGAHIVGPAIGTHEEIFMNGQADEYLASFGNQHHPA